MNLLYLLLFILLRNNASFNNVSKISVSVSVLWSRNILVDSVTVPIVYDPDKPNNHATEGNFAMLAASSEIDGNQYSLARLIPRKIPFKHLNGKFLVAAFGYQKVNVTKLFINGELHDVQKGGSNGKLHYAKAKLLSHTDCQDILRDNITADNMCAQLIGLNKDSPAGICKFDSGDPLTHQFYIDGLAINGGLNCNDNESPGIYINIWEYNTFIRNVMQNETTSKMLILQLRKDNEGEYMFKVMSTAQQD